MDATQTNHSNSIPLAPSTLVPVLEDQFLSMAFITQLTGLTDKWFYKLIQDGKFPQPIKFGRSSRWLKSEVESWIRQKIYDSRKTEDGY